MDEGFNEAKSRGTRKEGCNESRSRGTRSNESRVRDSGATSRGTKESGILGAGLKGIDHYEVQGTLTRIQGFNETRALTDRMGRGSHERIGGFKED